MTNRPALFQHVTREPSKTNRKGLRYTIAYTFEKEGDTLNVSYGIAQCHAGANGSKGDLFTRENGRNISLERLVRRDTKVSPYFGKFSITDADGLSVGRLIQDRFEAQRRHFMKKGRPASATLH